MSFLEAFTVQYEMNTTPTPIWLSKGQGAPFELDNMFTH